jgi:multiple sugar transport system substrate-binding protein
MRQRYLTIGTVAMLIFAACQGASSPGPGETGSPAAGTPSATSSEAAFDPSAISGQATLGYWQSSDAETKAIQDTCAAFTAKYPNVKLTCTLVPGTYKDVMVTHFGAHDAPDIFFVNAEYAPEWIDQGFLLSLDDYIAKQGFDTSPFFKNYLDEFTGKDGHVYGLPKDGNTIAMAYNKDLVPTPPTTLDELVTMTQGLKGKGSLKAPMCLNAALDRGLAFIYAQGGSLLTADNSAEAIDTAESKAAVQWYMDLFKNGLGMTNGDLGDSWCGEALGKGDVAIAFEGGWLLPYMQQTYPNINWAYAEMPAGSIGSKVTISYTAAYGIGIDSPNQDAAWVAMQYLTGPEGMAKWTSGGIAVPSRSDVQASAGLETITAGAAYARAGSGFMPGYNAVQDAFSKAFTVEITNKTFSADPVVSATATAITTALSAQ